MFSTSVYVFVQCEVYEQNPLRAQLRGTGTDCPHGTYPHPRMCHTVSVIFSSSPGCRWGLELLLESCINPTLRLPEVV